MSALVSGLVEADSGSESDRPFETVRTRLDGLREGAFICRAVDAAAERLFEADDAAEMKRALSAGLQSKGPFETVQVVETDAAGERHVVDGSGNERSALAPELAVPAVRAAVRDVADSRQGAETVRTDSPPRETAVTVAPIRPGKRKRSVLVASRDADVGSDAAVESRLETLGYLAGFALRTVRDEELLLGERRVELEFEVTGESCLAVPISSELDCYCEVQHATLTGDGEHLLFVRVDHPDLETAAEVTSGVDSVTDCRVVDSGDAGCVLEVTKTESSARTLMNVGATVLEASAADSVGRLVIELPPSVDPEDVVDEYVSRTDSAHLVAQRTVDEPIEVPTAAGDVLESRLTDKQRTAVSTAYHAGYFDWPRKSTAEDVASSLSVSSPTFQQHLRRALHKILDAHV
jgi:predicted DNA binding protein